jgi:hypothetical protein
VVEELNQNFMKVYIVVLALSFFPASGYCQSMVEIFKKLPADCTPQLSKKERTILLQKGKYILPGSDSIETVVYSIDTNTANDYLRYEYNFTTGQNGFITFELRKFKKANGKYIVVYSRIGGMLRAFDQQALTIYNLQNGKLVENKENLLPAEVPIKEFIKRNTQDSIVAYIGKYSTRTFDLNPQVKNTICYNIFPNIPLDNYANYIAGEKIYFRWNGKRFIKKTLQN